MRQLASLRGGLQLCALAIGDVPDDAEDLVAVAADDARLVEALVVVEPQRVFDLLGFVRRAARTNACTSVSAIGEAAPP